MDSRQVMVDSFVATIKQAAALCRGDLTQVDNYGNTRYRLTAGEFGHFTAAATGEGLAVKIIEYLVDYCNGEIVVGLLLIEDQFPGHTVKKLERLSVRIIDHELPSTLGELPDATKMMLWGEMTSIIEDIARGREGNAIAQWEAAKREGRSGWRKLEAHAPWIGRLLTEILKAMGR